MSAGVRDRLEQELTQLGGQSRQRLTLQLAQVVRIGNGIEQGVPR